MESDIKRWLQVAFFDLFNSDDKELLDRNVHEEAINHRLAYWLEKHRPAKYSAYYVDMEFNKNGDEKKIINDKNSRTYMRPDIIIHKRTKDDGDNLIAIECKKEDDSDYDITKLDYLGDHGYNYRYCIAVRYMPRENFFYLCTNETDFENSITVPKNTCSW